MEASFMNPHRAIDYLFNPSLMPAAPPAAPAATDAAPAATPVTEGTGGSQPAAEGDAPSLGAGNLDFLRNQPQVRLSYFIYDFCFKGFFVQSAFSINANQCICYCQAAISLQPN